MDRLSRPANARGLLRASCAALASFALAGALGANAATAPQPSPSASPVPAVEIRTCEVSEKNGIVPAKGVHIVWVNQRLVPIAGIDIDVKYGGEVQSITDEGAFTHGSVISHSYNIFTGFAFTGPTPAYCRVTQIRYYDGSSVAP